MSYSPVSNTKTTPYHDPLDAIAVGSFGLLLCAGRVLIASLFLQSAISKSLHWKDALAELASYGIPGGSASLVPVILAQFVGGIGLVIGFKTRWSAFVLILFMLPATFYVHGFYRYSGEAFSHHLLGFFQNLTLIGGLVLLFATGPGRWSLDAGTSISQSPRR